MIDSLKELNKMIEAFTTLSITINKNFPIKSRYAVFANMIIKKSIDILTTAKFVVKNNIITVQISLLRLMCDNALAIEAATILGVDEMMDMINEGVRPSSVMIDEENNMSDGYLKSCVSKKYNGFSRLYNFACDAVHFSKQTVLGIMQTLENDSEIKAGNPELKQNIIQNNQQMITLSKVIIDMLVKLM